MRTVTLLIGVLVGAAIARADLTTATCLAAKVKAWGRARTCEADEAGRVLKSLPADARRCQTKLTAKLLALSYRAAVVGVPCRFGDGGDGTVTDYDTGLQWEKKTDDGTVHDKDNLYAWVVIDGFPDIFTTFLRTLNRCESSDGTTGGQGFAGRCDWRIATAAELRRILDANAPGCGPSGACLDTTVFGPTGVDFGAGLLEWSATNGQGDTGDAWVADLHTGRMTLSSVYNTGGVHAVRVRY